VRLFAPLPIENAQPAGIQRAWAARRSTTWFRLQADTPLHHYADLKRLPDEYADALAAAIDNDTFLRRSSETRTITL
jgi:hypothetical protein